MPTPSTETATSNGDIARNLFREVAAAYRFVRPAHVEQIHNGTHRVYRLKFPAGAAQRNVALKISRYSGAGALRAKQLEYGVLTELLGMLDFTPRIIAPQRDTGSLRCYPWGVLHEETRIVSCYEWLPGARYQRRAPFPRNLAAAYRELREALARVGSPGAGRSDCESGLRFIPNGAGLMFDPRWRLGDLVSGDSLSAGRSPEIAVVRTHGDFLDAEVSDLRRVFATQEFALRFPTLSWLHRELSPSNVGFSARGRVTAIYDFDSLAPGVWMQDVAWLAATFCVDYRRSVTESIASLRELVGSLCACGVMRAITAQCYLLPFMRLAYLDSVLSKLRRARHGIDARLGFVKEDICTLRWLRRHGDALLNGVGELGDR